MEELKPQLVEFDKINQIIPKIYLSNYEVGRDKYQTFIIIIYNKYIF